MKTYTDAQILGVLKAMVAKQSQVFVATALGFQPSIISETLSGKRGISESLARELGFIKLDNRYTRKQGA